MAVNLNTPADFEEIKSIPKSSKDFLHEELLPPSLFERKKAPTPTTTKKEDTDTVDTLLQLQELKKENQKLKELQSHVVPHVYQAQEQFRYGTEVNRQLQVEQQSAKQDIINRHEAEIKELEHQNKQKEATQREETYRLQSKLELTQLQQIETFKKQLTAAESQHKHQIDQLEDEKYKVWSESERKNEILKGQFQQTKSEYETLLNAMQNELDSVKEDSNIQFQQFSSQMREYEMRVESQDKEIRQLSSDLSKAEKINKSTEAWRAEVHCLKENIESLHTEKLTQEQSAVLLKLRLKSQNEIMLCQESEISKYGNQQNEKKEVHQALLTRWREKVFSVLVQQKSKELLAVEDKRKYSQQMCGQDRELSTAKNHIEVLKHTLVDRSAELDIEKNKVKSLQAELTSLQQQSLHVENNNKLDAEAVVALSQVAEQFWNKYLEAEEKINVATKAVKAYGQRMDYMSGRLHVLQGLFTRQEALLKMKLEEQCNKECHCQVQGNSIETLQAELDKVSSERNHLVEQMKEDALLLDDKIKTSKKDTEKEISTLKGDLENITKELELKTERCLGLSEKLDTAERYVVELKEYVDKLKADLAKQQTETVKSLEAQRTSDHSEFSNQLAEFEKQVNEARREHAKAVVCMRQMERQCTREKERVAENTQSMEQYYKQHVDQLQHKVTSLEKDKNILIATLRQEGLLLNNKPRYGNPATLNNEDEDIDLSNNKTEKIETDIATFTTSRIPEEAQTGQDESFHTVIDDLKALTAEVISDEDENIENHATQTGANNDR